MYENRKYVIVPTSEIDNVDFNQVLESSSDTCRYSVDRLSTFVKYEGEMPSSVAALSDISEEYTHSEILEILSTEQWTSAEDTQGA